MRIDLSDNIFFLFAHQDDEFFCLPWIAEAVANGSRVACAYLTNGGYGGQSVERRVEESKAVMTSVGVDEADIHFPGIELSIPDGRLHLHANEAFGWISSFHRRYHPSRIIVPSWEGGHQDHDAVFAIAAHLSALTGSEGGRFHQFALYNAFQTRLFRVMHPLPANGPTHELRLTWQQALRHLRHVFSYPSQWKTWMGLLPFTVWRFLRSRSFYLQDMDPRRVIERPHQGPLLYERRGFASHLDVVTAIHEALSPHSGLTPTVPGPSIPQQQGMM